MSISVKQIQIIHVAKSFLRMEDDDYRAMLRQVAGVTSSRDLDAAGFRAVMKRFERLGFTTSGALASPQDFGVRPGRASPRQIDLIRDLWGEFKGEEANDLTLGHWLERTFHLSSIRFLGYDEASKVIGALKMMKARNFDRGPKSGGETVSGSRKSRKITPPFNVIEGAFKSREGAGVHAEN